MPTASKLLIFDCRPKINAQANAAKGGGYEKSEFYIEKDSGEPSTFVALLFCDIENIHVMRDSLGKVHEALSHNERKLQKKWFQLLDESRWFHHLRLLLIAAGRVAERIENTGVSVLVHCSDGWDRTAQTTALAQLMLDGYFRLQFKLYIATFCPL